MSTQGIRGKAAIVGVGISEHGEVPGWSHFELMAQAVERACADAGIKSKDIDGVFAAITPSGLPVSMVSEYLGLQPKVLEGMFKVVETLYGLTLSEDRAETWDPAVHLQSTQTPPTSSGPAQGGFSS